MNNKLKIIGTVLTIATFTAGGVVGGTILANQNTAQQVAEAEDKGYQEGHKDAVTSKVQVKTLDTQKKTWKMPMVKAETTQRMNI